MYRMMNLGTNRLPSTGRHIHIQLKHVRRLPIFNRQTDAATILKQLAFEDRKGRPTCLLLVRSKLSLPQKIFRRAVGLIPENIRCTQTEALNVLSLAVSG